MHTDLDIENLPPEMVDAATAALFRALQETGRSAAALDAMTPDERRLVQAALLRHDRRFAAGDAQLVPVAVPGPAGLGPARPAAACTATDFSAPHPYEYDPEAAADPDWPEGYEMCGYPADDAIHRNEYGQPVGSEPTAVDPIGATYLDHDAQRTGAYGRYFDYAHGPRHEGGRTFEIGDDGIALHARFTRDEWLDVVAALRGSAYHDRLDGVSFDDGRGVEVYDDEDQPGHRVIELVDEDGQGVQVPVDRAGLARLAAGVAADLLDETLEDLDERGRGELVPGTRTSRVQIVTLPDGRRIVHKDARLPAEPDAEDLAWAARMRDAEVLTAMVATAVGAPVAQISTNYARNGHEMWIEHVPGSRVYELTDLDERERAVFGLLDVITGNQRRQVMRRDDDRTAVGIDHGENWLMHVQSDPAQPWLREDTAPMAEFVERVGNREHRYRPCPPVDLDELHAVRGRLAELREEFVERGHGDWLDYSLGVLDQLITNATPLRRPVKIETDDGDVRVTAYPTVVRVELAHWPEDPAADDGPVVLLDDAGVLALADAAERMAAAERAGRDAYQRLDARIRRLEHRREQIENQRSGNRGAEFVALEKEFEHASSRGDQLLVRQRERLALLSPADRAAFDDLEAQLHAGADRTAVRAAQRRIIMNLTAAELAELDSPATSRQRRAELRRRPGGLPDDTMDRRALFLIDQDEADELADRRAELRRRAEAIPTAPLTPAAEAELARVKADLDAAFSAEAEMVDSSVLASGTIATPGGAGLAWQTTMRDEGRVRHELDRRPPTAGDQWHVGSDNPVPDLTLAQVRRVVTAATVPAGQARPAPPPAVPSPGGTPNRVHTSGTGRAAGPQDDPALGERPVALAHPARPALPPAVAPPVAPARPTGPNRDMPGPTNDPVAARQAHLREESGDESGDESAPDAVGARAPQEPIRLDDEDRRHRAVEPSPGPLPRTDLAHDELRTDGEAPQPPPVSTRPSTVINDPLRVGGKLVLPDGQSFAGSGSAKDDDGNLLLAAAVDTPQGRMVHVGVPIVPEEKPHWKGAYAPAQETHVDPDSDPDDADEDRLSTVDTGADTTVVLDAGDAARLPEQVDAIIAEATAADQRYRKAASRCDQLYDERSNLEAKRFTDPADADLQLRLDSRESQHTRYQKLRRAEMDEAADRLSPADRARYDEVQRRIEQAGADLFDPDKDEQAAAVCGMPVNDYRDLVELEKTFWNQRTPEQDARAKELDSGRLPPLLAEQAAIIRGLDLADYRELEALDKIGSPHRGFGGRPGGRNPQQQARYEQLCTAPGGATGATPQETARLRDRFETYQRAHHSDKLSWTAERRQRAALAERARPLDHADADRLQRVIAEHDELSGLYINLGGEVITSVEVPGRSGTTLLVEAVQREEEGGVDYRVDCKPASRGETYRTTAGGLRKITKVIAALAAAAGLDGEGRG